MRIAHAPRGLAIADRELQALRRHLHAQVSREEQAFWRDLRNEQHKMEEREQELAQRRREIESRHAARLLKKRQRLLPQIDWRNPPDFEDEAARKLHHQNLAEIDRQFSPEAFLDRLAPCLFDFASCVALFERTRMGGIPPSQRQVHMRRTAARILEMIFPRTPVQDPPPPEAKHVRMSEEKVWAGKVIAGPFEILLDERRRPVGYRRAPYAERRGEFEHLPIESLGVCCAR